MTYVVLVHTGDDNTRVHGSFRSKAPAVELADKINAAVELVEDREFAEWQALGADPDVDAGMMPSSHGMARVHYVHPPRVRRMVRFALGELDA